MYFILATTCTGTAAATGALQVDLSPNKANYDDGECILYMCKDGYAYSEGNLSRVCEDGFWSGKAPVCTGMR